MSPRQPFASHSPTIYTAEKVAWNLGVTASYGTNLYMANNVNEALRIIRDAGLPLPTTINDDFSWFMNRYPQEYKDRQACAECDMVRLNSAAEYWQGHASKISQLCFSQGFWSTSSELHVALHELMHVAQYLHNRREWDILQSRTFSERERGQIMKQVSLYATRNPREFLAEVGTGVLLGKRFMPATMELYRSLKGVPR